jgi:hypothetical protein
LAREEGLAVSLAQEMAEMLEARTESVIVRDEGDARLGLQWQANVMAELEGLYKDVNFV